MVNHNLTDSQKRESGRARQVHREELSYTDAQREEVYGAEETCSALRVSPKTKTISESVPIKRPVNKVQSAGGETQIIH